MIVSGLWLLVFIVIHVKAFRYGIEYEWPAGGRDLYRLEMENFANPLMVGFYVLSMIVVGSHLWHGISSSIQSLGLDHPRWTPRVLVAGKVAAVAHCRRVHRHRPVGALRRSAAREHDHTGREDSAGPIAAKWDRHKFEMKLVNPANKRKYTVIVVGTGLAGGAAAASLGELGYNVLNLLHPGQPAPRAQHRRAGRHQRREELPERRRQRLSPVLRHDQGRRLSGARSQRLPAGAAERQHHRSVRRAGRAVRARVRRPARQPIVRRRAGVAHVLRARPDRPAAAARRVPVADAPGAAKTVRMFPRREMLDLVLVDGKARGIIVRNLITGEIERYAGDAVILATGGYGTAYYLSTNAVNANVTASWRAHKRGALFANPCFTQIHPTCIPVTGSHQSKLTLMSESLRNDGRVWVPEKKGDTRPPEQIPEDERDYFLERKYPSFGNLVPRDVASRNIKQVCDEGRGVGRTGLAVYLDFRTRSRASASTSSRKSTATSSRCIRRSPTKIRTRRRCASTPPSTTRWAACGWITT